MILIDWILNLVQDDETGKLETGDVDIKKDTRVSVF